MNYRSIFVSDIHAFVFPSRTDTFGIVLLEAIASGIPVIAYPEPGPLEVIEHNINGIITDDLSLGLKELSCINKENVIRSSLAWTWKRSAQNFVNIIGV